MITPAQVKAQARNKSKETGIQSQALIHLFMMERFIVRVSKSEYRDSFIVKGGFLIGSLIGVENRTTMDIDATITGLTVNEETMTKMLKEICTELHEDGIEFSFDKLTPIREEEDYQGFRASLIGRLSNMRIPFKLDIGTGDAITPKEVRHTHPSMFPKIAMFEEEKIHIMSYPVQTVLAEKVETILRRGVLNTRTRDFYDVYMLMRLYDNDLSDKECADALMNTMKSRKSTAFFKDYKEIIEGLKNDTTKQSDWNRYQKQFSYAKGIHFNDTLNECQNFCDAVIPHFEV